MREGARKNTSKATRPAHLQKLLRRNEVAQIFGCNYWTVMRMEERGDLHPIKLNPRCPTAAVYYNVDEINAILDQHRNKGRERVRA